MDALKYRCSSILILGLFLTSANAQFGDGEDQSANKHLAAFHYSVVCTGKKMPSSVILTYPVNEFRVQDYNFLLKLMPCLLKNGHLVKPSAYEKVHVEDFPGGVKATIDHQGSRIITRITPLLVGRGSQIWQGAVLYEIETDPSEEVLVYLGGGETINLIWGFESSIMKQDSVNALEELEITEKSTLKFSGGKEDLSVGVKTSGIIEVNKGDTSLSEVRVKITGGSGHIFTAFSEDPDQMKKLMNLDASAKSAEVQNYYSTLLQSNIKTPEKIMNEAFASAIYNLEYSWLEPFGWGECLHHWLALWYMQVTPAAEWIGQEERARSSILAHGQEAFENGAIPMFNPNHLKLGLKRRDWGGANTFWAWQVRHYVKQTGDLDFAKQVLPILDRAIAQTLEEYDPDGNLLLAWGLQIGNQEDFVANPYDGSVPTMELINMYKTRAELSRFTGDVLAERLWTQKADQIREVLYKNLWIKDLGRFAYYKDPTGRVLPDGQYQTYLYPAIYELVDEYDQYSGIRHLRDRLTDREGAVFASNNFAWHVPESVSTWGMQRGAAQQPWTAMGLASTGMFNETWKPLMAMAKWAQDPRRPGAWPETGPEPTPAYFTPPAGLYISTVVESLFGLEPNLPEGYLGISPSIPDHWPEASLSLPGIQADYRKDGNRVSYIVESDFKLPLEVNWRLPVSKIKRVRVNNQVVEYEVIPGVKHVILHFEAPISEKSIIQIEYAPLEIHLEAPLSLACGDSLSLRLFGASITKITDKSGVLKSFHKKSPQSIEAVVQGDLLNPYMKFRQLGQLNFSRRTFFLDCITPDGIQFIEPVDLTLLPRIEASIDGPLKSSEQKLKILLLIRNNSNKVLNGNANILVGEQQIILALDIPPRSEKKMELSLPEDLKLASGTNELILSCPGEGPVSVSFRHPFAPAPPVFSNLVLPEEQMITDSNWNQLRVMPGHPHIFFTFSSYGWPQPMESLVDVNQLRVPQIQGLTFKLAGRKFIPLSHLSGKTSIKLKLEKKTYKKIYLLVLPFVDNHDVFSEIARISAYSGNHIVSSRTLSYPGDLDYWVSNRNPTSFATFREERASPSELLPVLTETDADWEEGKPPDFPQSRWWSASIPLGTESCVFSIIELSIDSHAQLDHLVVESLGALPALGIVAITAELNE